MYKLLFVLLLGLLSGCTYVRPPAGEGVKSYKASDSVTIATTNTGAAQAKNPTPERAKPILQRLELPEGFQIEVFAQVPNARSLALAYDIKRNRQIIFVGNKDKSSVYALIDEWSNNTVDTTKEITKNLATPNGVAYYDGNLYVAQVSKIHEYPTILDALASGWTITSRVIYDKLPKDLHHGRKYIAFWPDGRLYIPVGAPCNVCDREEPYASILALDIKTKQTEIIAKGIRNTVGFTRHPDTEQLWFTDNGRDLMGDNMPPDELNVVSKTWQHFGFPFCHGMDIVDPISSKSNCEWYTAPQVILGPHVAALGIKFYTGTMFPSHYKNKIFIAEHGSRNRSVPLGYRISLVDPEKKTYEIFAQWRLSENKTRWRPVDVLQLKDGSLLISDDYAGIIYRISYNQTSP